MGTWGTDIFENDLSADLQSEFMELYNNNVDIAEIKTQIIKSFSLYNAKGEAVLENNTDAWLSFASCLWDCKALNSNELNIIQKIISSGIDLKNWQELDAGEADLKEREINLKKFLQKIQSKKKKDLKRSIPKIEKPPFSKGDLISFKLKNGNYGALICLYNSEGEQDVPTNTLAVTRINQKSIPTKKEIMKSHIVIKNFEDWKNDPVIVSKSISIKNVELAEEARQSIETMNVIDQIEIVKEFHPYDYLCNFKWDLDSQYSIQREQEEAGLAQVNLQLSAKKLCGIENFLTRIFK